MHRFRISASKSTAFAILIFVHAPGKPGTCLNPVAASDPNPLYNERMTTGRNIAGILCKGGAGNFSPSVIEPQGVQTIHANSPDRPITYVNWGMQPGLPAGCPMGNSKAHKGQPPPKLPSTRIFSMGFPFLGVSPAPKAYGPQ